MKSLRAILFVSALLAVLVPMRSPAPLYQDGYSDSAARNLATNYSSSVGRLSLHVTQGDFQVSGVFLNNQWYLTAAHSLINPFGTGDATINGIYPGATNGGLAVASTATFIYPGYDGTGNNPDLALLRVATPVNAPTLSFASASVDEVVTSVGFGAYGSVSGGVFVPDNFARGWRASVSSTTFGGYSATYYQSANFSPIYGLSLNGKGVNGDSGSSVFNTSGKLVGINIASGGGLTPIGDTEFLRLTQADVYGWIQNIITPVAPQVVSLVREGADVRLTWQGKGGSNYVVQAASALGGTNTFSDLSAPIALPGVGPVLTNYLDAGALTNHPTRFYRIRLQ